MILPTGPDRLVLTAVRNFSIGDQMVMVARGDVFL